MVETAVPEAPSSTDRTHTIEQQLAATENGHHLVPSESGYIEVPVTEVDQALLVYRIENGRILSEVAAAASDWGETIEDLQQHAEIPRVQQLLHALLTEKARDPDGPIYNELARHAHQTEPLLIQRDGLVLNGNRRLAAMRELRAAEPERYRHFQSVRVGVLPNDVGRDKLEFIEAALQMAPDLKLEYSWINRRLKLRQHCRDLGREEIVAAYRFPDPEAVDIELAELKLAEAYLTWINARGAYERIASLEDRFVELRRQLDKLNREHMRELWQLLGFHLIHAETKLDIPITHYFPFTDPTPPAVRQWVPRCLAEDHGVVDRQLPGENRGLDKAAARDLWTRLDDPQATDATARAIIALTDTLKSDSRRLLAPAQIVQQLRAARQSLENLADGALTDQQLRIVKGELAAIQVNLESSDNSEKNFSPPHRSRRNLSWRSVLRRIKNTVRLIG